MPGESLTCWGFNYTTSVSHSSTHCHNLAFLMSILVLNVCHEFLGALGTNRHCHFCAVIAHCIASIAFGIYSVFSERSESCVYRPDLSVHCSLTLASAL